jgi:sugar phosphate isomerase/epimerase
MTAPRLLPSTTSHKHEPLDSVLEVFARLGLRDLDLNLWHCVETGVPVRDVTRLLTRFDQRVWIVSGGWCDFFEDGPVKDETARSVERQVELARALGVSELRLFFGRLPRTDWSTARLRTAVENLSRLSDRFPDLTFLMENHGREASGVPEVCADILAAVGRPNVQMTFDPINFEYAGANCLEALRTVRSYVRHVHLKGLGAGEFCEFGAGEIDLTPVLRDLVSGGYARRFTVEYEGRFDRTLRLYRGLETARAFFETLSLAS